MANQARLQPKATADVLGLDLTGFINPLNLTALKNPFASAEEQISKSWQE